MTGRKRMLILFLAALLCLPTGLNLSRNVLAEDMEATPLGVVSDPPEAVIGAEVEILGPTGLPGEVSLKIIADLNANFIEDKTNSYSKDFVDMYDPEIPMSEEPGGSEGGGSEGGGSEGGGSESGGSESGGSETGGSETGGSETGGSESGGSESGGSESGGSESGGSDTQTTPATTGGEQGDTQTTPATTGGEGDTQTPPGSETGGEGDTQTPPGSETGGEGDTQTPPGSETGGEDDTQTPPGSETGGEDDTQTPPGSETGGEGDTQTPPGSEIGGEVQFGGGGGGGGAPSTTTTLYGRQALDMLYSLSGKQTVADEINSLRGTFPVITYTAKLDGGIFDTASHPGDVGVIYAGSDNVGIYTITRDGSGNHIINAELDGYVYYLSPPSVEYVVTAHLANASDADRIVGGSVLDGDVFSLDIAGLVQALLFGDEYGNGDGYVKDSNIAFALKDTAGANPYYVNGDEISEAIFEKIWLKITSTDQDSLQFALHCDFNSEFLLDCFDAVGGNYDHPDLPSLSFNFTVDSNDYNPQQQMFKFDSGTYQYITSTDESYVGVRIGIITIDEEMAGGVGTGVYKFSVEFYPYEIYSADMASGDAVFTARLENTPQTELVPMIEEGGHGEIIIKWEGKDPLLPEDDTPKITASKTGPGGTIDNPYVTYTLQFDADDDETDLRELIIADDLKPLHLLGFDYTVTVEGAGSPQIIQLPFADAGYGGCGQPILYSKKDGSPDITSDTALGELQKITDNLEAVPENQEDYAAYYENGEVFLLDMSRLPGLPEGRITSVRVNLYTMLDAAAYSDFMYNINTLKITNEAFGYYNDGEDGVKVSGTSADTVSFQYFKKEGVPVTTDGKNKMNYTVSAQTYFMTSNGDAFIVDKIYANAHTLKPGSILFYPGGTPVTEKYLDDPGGTPVTEKYLDDKLDAGDKKSYDELADIETLRDLWAEIVAAEPSLSATDSTQAAVYTVSSGEQIIIFRLGNQYLNSPVKLTYTTVLNQSYEFGDKDVKNDAKIFVGNKYLGGWGLGIDTEKPVGMVEKNYKVDYRIASKAHKKWTASTLTSVWTVNVNTAREDLEHAVVKDTIDLTEMKPVKLGGVLLEDFINGTETTLTLSGNINLTYVTPEEFDESYEWEGDNTPPENPFGNFFTYDGSVEGKGVIKLYFEKIGVAASFDIETRLADVSALANNSSSSPKSVTNVLDAYCWNGTSPVHQEQAEATYAPYINKVAKASGAYDYADGTIQWTIKANSGSASYPSVSIKNMVLTDFLPPESYLSEITGITYGGTVYDVSPNSFSESGEASTLLLPFASGLYLKVIAEASRPYPAGTAAATDYNVVRFIVTDSAGNQADYDEAANNVTDTQLEITLKTKFKEEYKRVMTDSKKYTNYVTLDGIVGYEDTDGDLSFPSEGTIGKAALDGTYGGGNPLGVTNQKYYTAKPSTAKATAQATVKLMPMVKSAEYDRDGYDYANTGEVYKGPDTLHWTILINRELYEGVVTELGHAVVKDVINPDDKDYFLLKPETMQVSTVSLDAATGDARYVTSIGDVYDHQAGRTPGGVFNSLDEKGFEFVVPRNEIYEIKFDTVIVTTNTLIFSQLLNKARIEYPDKITYREVTGYYKNNSFEAHTFASISYMPHIYVIKSHKESAFDSTTKIPVVCVAGVEFNLSGYAYTMSGGVMTIDYDNKVYDKTVETAHRDSVQAGTKIASAVFPLTADGDVVYILTEVNLGAKNEGTYLINPEPRYIILGGAGVPGGIPVSVNIQGGAGRRDAVLEVVHKGEKAVYYNDLSGTSLESEGISAHGSVTGNTADNKYYSAFTVFNEKRNIRPKTVSSVVGMKKAVNLVSEKTGPVKYALFGLYDNYGDALDPLNGGIDQTYSDENGEFRFDNLAAGTYYMRELTQPGFEIYDMSDMLDPADASKINPEKIIAFTVTGTPNSADKEIIRNDSDGKIIEVINYERIPVGEIVGYKESIDGVAVPGAQFGLFQNGRRIDTAVAEMVNGRAEFRFSDIELDPNNEPFIFTVIETLPPVGYDNGTTVYTVQFNGDDPTIEIEYENSITGDELVFRNRVTARQPDDNGGGGGGGGGGDNPPPTGPTVEPPPVVPPEEPPVEPPVEEPPVEPPVEPPIEEPPVEPLIEEPEEPGTITPPPVIQEENVPPLSEIPEEQRLHPAQLPENYTAVELEPNVFVIYDDEDVPLGYVVVPEGMTLDDINIMEELIPFGIPVFEDDVRKPNPATRDWKQYYIFLAGILALALGVCLIVCGRIKKNLYR